MAIRLWRWGLWRWAIVALLAPVLAIRQPDNQTEGGTEGGAVHAGGSIKRLCADDPPFYLHAPLASATARLPVDEPTTLFWVVNAAPKPALLGSLSGSVQTVVYSRARRERLRLFVLVYESNRTAAARSTVTCDVLLPPAATDAKASRAERERLASLSCSELYVWAPSTSCQAASPPPLAHGDTITIVRLTGAWNRHRQLLGLASLRGRYHQALGEGREDLAKFAAQTLLRYFAHAVLLPLGVPRAVYLDCDTAVLKSLMPLHRALLPEHHVAAAAVRCSGEQKGVNASNPFIRGMGFVDDQTQGYNTGVMLFDLEGMCARGATEQMRVVAAEAVAHPRTMWRNVNTFDQPVCEIALARNTTMLTRRVNCREYGTFDTSCYVLHGSKASTITRSEAVASTWSVHVHEWSSGAAMRSRKRA
jgi:hypothetical protein